MKQEIYADHAAMSRAAADWLAQRIDAKPNSLMCMATGATPLRCYQMLAHNPKQLFKELRILKLDEWGGIPMSSPATCETFLRRTFVDPLGLTRFEGFMSEPPDAPAECARINQWLVENGPIDLCILGLGL